jgi:glutaredoxin-like YruB-family protein
MDKKSVTIYTTPTCGYCKAAKAFFQENDVDYTEVDVAADQDKAKEMIELSGQMGVPVIKIGDGDDAELVVGFDQNHLSHLLGVGS